MSLSSKNTYVQDDFAEGDGLNESRSVGGLNAVEVDLREGKYSKRRSEQM